MDPYVSAVGRRGVPLLVDCRSLAHQEMPLPHGVEAAWVDTGVERRLSETPYAERRKEVERGVARLREARPELGSLRDLWPSAYASLEGKLPEPERRRCRHVVGEIDRVGRAGDALRAGDAVTLGALLDEGHRSLSQNFECSTPAIDALVAAERGKPESLGVRLQGAGWGGCLVVLRKRTVAE
jgi:galactokinase